MLLTVDTVTKTYPGGRPVLRGASITLDRGQSLALTGESGSGKSTLLNLTGALDGFDSGEIILDGVALSRLDDAGRAALRRDHVALVFQQFNLIPALTVAQNLSFQARLAGRLDADWLKEITARLGLGDLTERYPEQLSGGQQQRVAIGRAMAGRPKLLLADEPTGNLDETAAGTVLDLMLDLVRDSGTALLLVTHSQAIAARLDRRAHLTGGRVAA
ncbi:ABC transporter ATP-binding protein [Ruegeria sp. 1NDH52C]|uniref:ABC transporter ATP-binding protein n=1 Tax=Ruegeria alba TaxID=2916756 RepID=A0ABS9NSY7_9RHOB|nr:ABC transporter ATP-binding protein [Ruegeria alba]MCG6557064.1 ABC transporter ATP-binding protein [Ruegeria alba]